MPCNLKFFNIIEYLHKCDTLVWKATPGIKDGDIVYIYVGIPYSCVRYRCVVIKEKVEQDILSQHDYARVGDIEHNKRYMQLKLIYTYEKGVSLAKLQDSRLLLARNLLAENGVIFISIDDNELGNLKKICEEIFGATNFIANIVWKHTQQSKNDELHFSRQYNHTLVYAANKASVGRFYFERTDIDNRNYGNPDNDPRGPWRTGDVRSPNYRRTLCFDIIAPNGNVIMPPDNGWRWSEESIKNKIASGEIKFRDDYSGIIRKIYLYDQPGRTPENLWEGPRFGTTRQAAAMIKELFDGVQVFDTPKPHELIKAMLQLSTDKDSIIMDFFSGSGTTAQAVMDLNAHDDGKRRFVLVQIDEPCDENSTAYKAGYRTICEIGKERIRRAGKRIKEEAGLLAGHVHESI